MFKQLSKCISVGLLLLLTVIGKSYAHESRPLFVEISERGTNTFSVVWKIPPSAENVPAPNVLFPEVCQPQAPVQGSRLVKQQLFQCSSDLSGDALTVQWPAYNPSISTLFRFQRLSGEVHSGIMGPDSSQWKIPGKEDSAEIAGEYFVLGIEHILLGFDHLLFVACLIFIAGSIKRILVTVTGFTLAHSITLALAALGLVRLPIIAVEATIALSIIFLAYEIARVYLAKSQEHKATYMNTLTWRYPVIVASAFGLLHGFGFASVLNEIGLPQTELPTALLFFNVGVEFGQLLFILACIALAVMIKKLRVKSVTKPVSQNVQQPLSLVDEMPYSLVFISIYAIGLLSTYWLFDRLSPLFT